MDEAGFLKARGTEIVTAHGKSVVLKGVNLGGWLMMEGYILHSLNLPEQRFKKNFVKALGKLQLADFEKEFRNHFIEEKDIRRMAHFGFNCIRVPFNYRLVEKKPYRYDRKGLSYLDRVIRWAEKYHVWVILDLHAAPGAQNHDWHSDSNGTADFWTKKDFQKRTFALWEFLADRYKNKTAVAGYDLLNESVIDDAIKLNRFYKDLIRQIRHVDKNHILFVEGNQWARDLGCLDDLRDDNLVLSIHTYQPLDFTFNFVPDLSYPTAHRNKARPQEILIGYKRISKKRSVPIYVGEFGVNFRRGLYGEDRWLYDMLSVFKDFGFHWTYWTYKAIKNSIFPDGIFSFVDNPPWVNRQGPLLGWDTYHLYWPTRKKEMIQSWRTDSFKENKEISKILKDAAK